MVQAVCLLLADYTAECLRSSWRRRSDWRLLWAQKRALGVQKLTVGKLILRRNVETIPN